jgi:hypothetical protein
MLKDFTNGQFGMQLTTVPASLVEHPDLPEMGCAEYLKINLYVQVGNDPITGTPIFELVYAPFFDSNDNRRTHRYHRSVRRP